MKLATTTVQEIDRFANLVVQGMKAWITAGEIIAAGVDADPNFYDQVTELHPNFTEEILRRFEQLGRREIHPELLVSDCPGYKALRRLPYDLQGRFMKEGVELLVRKGSAYDTLKCDPLNLQQDQARQVFAKGRTRSLAEQRAWIESEVAELKVMALGAESSSNYQISRGKMVVTKANTTFTTKELARVLLEMENSR